MQTNEPKYIVICLNLPISAIEGSESQSCSADLRFWRRTDDIADRLRTGTRV